MLFAVPRNFDSAFNAEPSIIRSWSYGASESLMNMAMLGVGRFGALIDRLPELAPHGRRRPVR
jgi:hypothetical protein